MVAVNELDNELLDSGTELLPVLADPTKSAIETLHCPINFIQIAYILHSHFLQQLHHFQP